MCYIEFSVDTMTVVCYTVIVESNALCLTNNEKSFPVPEIFPKFYIYHSYYNFISA